MPKSGIDILGDVPWGTHFCQFYDTSADLTDTLVPYFRAGLEANEYCMWITSEPLHVAEATAALRAAVPDLDARMRAGQIEILDYTDWYVRDGRFDADAVLQGWVDRLDSARDRGYEGLRLTGNTFWLERANWDDFTRYEEAINDVIGRYRMLAICTYSLQRCGLVEVLDVVVNHEFALLKRHGRWQIIESTHHRKIEQALRQSEERLAVTLRSIGDGVIATDAQGQVTFMNPVAEGLTGWPAAEAAGRRGDEVFHVISEATRERVESPTDHALREGAVVGLANHSLLVRKDGREIPVADSGAPIRDVHGEITGAVLVFRDISRQREQEREVEQLNARLQRAMTETHHRVKNNLQVIAALVDLQVMTGAAAVPAAELHRLGRHIRGLAAVHDLLTHETHVSEGAGTISAADALGRLKPLLDGMLGGRELRFHVDDVRLPVRHGTSLAVLVNELVSNAVKHGRGEIDLSLAVLGRQARLEVCDRGPGFPPGFDPRAAASTGLDLIGSVGQWDLQGEVTFANAAGGGARVAITFPLPAG